MRVACFELSTSPLHSAERRQHKTAVSGTNPSSPPKRTEVSKVRRRLKRGTKEETQLKQTRKMGRGRGRVKRPFIPQPIHSRKAQSPTDPTTNCKRCGGRIKRWGERKDHLGWRSRNAGCLWQQRHLFCKEKKLSFPRSKFLFLRRERSSLRDWKVEQKCFQTRTAKLSRSTATRYHSSFRCTPLFPSHAATNSHFPSAGGGSLQP